jgi:hypothetical protein
MALNSAPPFEAMWARGDVGDELQRAALPLLLRSEVIPAVV